MALEYKAHTKFEALAPILEEYAGWFGDIALSVAYLDDDGVEAPLISVPYSFKVWLETQESLGSFILNDMNKVHEDLVRVGGMLVTALKDKKKPSRKDFEDFKNLYNAFLMRLRRVEKDSAQEGSGIDPDTGLRAAAVMQDDLKEEMERLGRHGNPFTLVICRIDFFAGHQDQEKSIQTVVKNIKQCMRSFDDAYYWGQGEFLLSLKHADKIGGQAAINRIQAAVIEDEDKAQEMTMSFCLCEPCVGDTISDLLTNMRQDLIDHMNEGNIILELTEVSALERYAAQL